MQSQSMSGQSRGDRHVDLDQKNSDSVYYDDQFMPDFQSHHRHKKERKKTNRSQQSKSQRKRVLQKKMKFIELTKEVKASDKKSTLSREEMRMQRHLYIMQNPNTKNRQNSKKTNSKNEKKNWTINPKFKLGDKSATEYLQKVYETRLKKKDAPEILSQDEKCQEDLTLSDREDIRICCFKFLKPKDSSRPKVQVSKSKSKVNKEGKGSDCINEMSKIMCNGSKNNKQYHGQSHLLEKRDFKDAFSKQQITDKVNGGFDQSSSLNKLGDDDPKEVNNMTYNTSNVNKKFFSEDIFFLDLTEHFKKYSLLPSIN